MAIIGIDGMPEQAAKTTVRAREEATRVKRDMADSWRGCVRKGAGEGFRALHSSLVRRGLAGCSRRGKNQKILLMI